MIINTVYFLRQNNVDFQARTPIGEIQSTSTTILRAKKGATLTKRTELA